jgi:hypothetical protein
MRRWRAILAWIRRPVITLALLMFLAGDLFFLPARYESGRVSHAARFARWLLAPATIDDRHPLPGAYFVRGGSKWSSIDPAGVGGWFATDLSLSTDEFVEAMQDEEADMVWVVLEYEALDTGLWAPTARTFKTSVRIEVVKRAKDLSDHDRDVLRERFANWLATKPGWDEVGATLEKEGNVRRSGVLWWGVMHTLLSALAMGALVLSLGWIGSFPRRALAWRARRQLARGKCPACGYEIEGMEQCPECGKNLR